MVCDIGGGTVDITAHLKNGEEAIEVVIPPMGNESGGRKVNTEFHNFLGIIVKDPDFSSFLQRSLHKAILTQVVYHDFENEKYKFGKKASDENDQMSLRLRLHHKFVEFYMERIIQGVKDLQDLRVTFDEQTYTLAIKYSRVKELFQPIMERVTDCVLEALQRVEGKVDVVYLVGGFGGCKYTYHKLKCAIESKYQSRVSLVVPKHHTLAVSQGAVLYRRNPECIQARRMDASYGIGCSVLFSKSLHKEHYSYTDPDDQRQLCRDVFLVFVEKGDKVAITDTLVDTLIPYSQEDKMAHFAFYSTARTNVQYIVDMEGHSNVEQIGLLKLEIPNPGDLPKWKRTMEVIMDFSSTEIKVQARATYLPNSPPVKASLDFLSAH